MDREVEMDEILLGNEPVHMLYINIIIMNDVNIIRGDMHIYNYRRQTQYQKSVYKYAVCNSKCL